MLGNTNSRNAFGMALGGGVDYRLTNRFSIRPLQVDYLLTRFREGTSATAGRESQNNLRASAGVVIHF